MAARKRTVVFYPVLLALYPVLYLISVNQAQGKLTSMLRSLVLAGLLGAGLYALLWFVLRSADRAALLASIWLGMFFGYGHVYNLVEGGRVAGVLLGRHAVLLAVWALCGLLAGVWLISSRAPFHNLSLILNVTSSVLVLVLVGQICFVQVRQTLLEQRQRAQDEQRRAERVAIAQTQRGEPLPDVYYIILDGHTRSDMLRMHYHFDNEPLLQLLRDQGFFIADCARSNYTYTVLSLSATLNMQYLQTLAPDLATAQGDAWSGDDGQYLRHSLVRRKFEEMGYRYVAFESGYPPYEARDADFFFARPISWQERWQTLDPFEELVLNTTLLRAPIERSGGLTHLGGEMISPNELQYRRIQYTLDTLESLPELPGPKFVFAHITSPHPPYVFAADGSFHFWPEEQKEEGCLAAVQYLDGRIAEIVQSIRAQSDPEPIIIIQGDHGIDGQTRLEVLNALYLPCAEQPAPYATMSSVNTFRIVFDACFGEHNGLLEDISYSSVWGQLTQFEVSPPQCSAKP